MTSWEGWRPKFKILDPLLTSYYWRRFKVLFHRVIRTWQVAGKSKGTVAE